MKIYIVRHGETVHNRDKVLMGWIGSELTDGGVKQAEDLSIALEDKDIEIIFASDLSRTKQTADIINRVLNIPVNYDWLLRERYMGKLEGESGRDIDWAKYNIDNEENSELGIEPIEHIQKRARAFVENLSLLPFSVSSVLIVAHNGTINSLLGVFDESHTYEDIPHGKIIEVAWGR